jgi:uncharacterized protein (DUF433 family)
MGTETINSIGIWQKTVISNSNIMMGKPVIFSTHITVELILEKLTTGKIAEFSHHDVFHSID